jgi:hypothetical protein
MKKGMLTNDDLSLFVSTQDVTNDKYNIFKVDIAEQKFTIIKDSDGNEDNQIDFHLLDVN